MTKYAEALLNVACLSIMGAVMAKPNSDANDIICITNISPSKVYRDLKILTDVKLITVTMIRTGAGYKKMTYNANHNRISFVLHKDKMRLDLRMS